MSVCCEMLRLRSVLFDDIESPFVRIMYFNTGMKWIFTYLDVYMLYVPGGYIHDNVPIYWCTVGWGGVRAAPLPPPPLLCGFTNVLPSPQWFIHRTILVFTLFSHHFVSWYNVWQLTDREWGWKASQRTRKHYRTWGLVGKAEGEGENRGDDKTVWSGHVCRSIRDVIRIIIMVIIMGLSMWERESGRETGAIMNGECSHTGNRQSHVQNVNYIDACTWHRILLKFQDSIVFIHIIIQTSAFYQEGGDVAHLFGYDTVYLSNNRLKLC